MKEHHKRYVKTADDIYNDDRLTTEQKQDELVTLWHMCKDSGSWTVQTDVADYVDDLLDTL